MAGTVGAIFNGALQLGSAVGIAAVSSIETSVEQKNGNPSGYAGRAAAYWFMLGIIGVEIVSLTVFYKVEPEHQHHKSNSEDAHDLEKADGRTSVERGYGIEEVEVGNADSETPECDDIKYVPDKKDTEEVHEECVV